MEKELAVRMVNQQLKPRDITSKSVLAAMMDVPRHLFVPDELRNRAYDDCPLPIGFGQTISQPYIVAYMTEQLCSVPGEPVTGMKVLEIGTGSGYQAAILAYLGCEVFTIELVEELYIKAKTKFEKLGFDSVHTRHGNGYSGWPEEAPFDAIIVTAAPKKIPENLIEQLREGGRMIVPVGEAGAVQYLKLITKTEGRIVEKDLLPVRFVPMVR